MTPHPHDDNEPCLGGCTDMEKVNKRLQQRMAALLQHHFQTEFLNPGVSP